MYKLLHTLFNNLTINNLQFDWSADSIDYTLFL